MGASALWGRRRLAGTVIVMSCCPPRGLTIVGPANRVNEVEQIETQELVLAGITSSFSRTLSLAVPQGVNLYSDPSVRVTVKVAKVQRASGTQEEPPAEPTG